MRAVTNTFTVFAKGIPLDGRLSRRVKYKIRPTYRALEPDLVVHKNCIRLHLTEILAPPPPAAQAFPERQYLFRQRAADAGRCAEMPSYNGIGPSGCAAPNANSIIRCRPPSV